MRLTVFIAFATEAQDHLQSLIGDKLTSALDDTIALMELLNTDERYNVDTRRFLADIRTSLESDPRAKKARFMRDALKTKIRSICRRNPAPNYLQTATGLLAERFPMKSSPDELYTAPSKLDAVFPYYIETSDLKNMIEPTALSLVYGPVDGSLAAIVSFAEMVAERLGARASKTKMTVCYCCLVRFLFDEAYVIGGELNDCAEENAAFLLGCELLSCQPIGALSLPQNLKEKYTPRMLVGSMFRPKQAEPVRGLDMILNPIDLIFHLHQGWSSVVKYFSSGAESLGQADAVKLFMVLLSVEPPTNAVALARFAVKWAKINLVPGAEAVPQAMLTAVEQIQAIEPYQGDGEEDEDE
jgi:hypothetical protein